MSPIETSTKHGEHWYLFSFNWFLPSCIPGYIIMYGLHTTWSRSSGNSLVEYIYCIVSALWEMSFSLDLFLLQIYVCRIKFDCKISKSKSVLYDRNKYVPRKISCSHYHMLVQVLLTSKWS